LLVYSFTYLLTILIEPVSLADVQSDVLSPSRMYVTAFSVDQQTQCIYMFILFTVQFVWEWLCDCLRWRKGSKEAG